MDTLKALLWLAIIAVAVMQVSCGKDKGKGEGVGLSVSEGKKKAKGCVLGIPRDCSIGNHTFKCYPPQTEAENGGTKCPPQVDIPDPTKPEHVEMCVVGEWGECEFIDNVWITRRSPIDTTADISTCPQLVDVCYSDQVVDCVMTIWSQWYDFPEFGISVRVRFVIIEPQNGGQQCPHDIETRSIDDEDCDYTTWSDWYEFDGFCFRWRTSVDPDCTHTFASEPAPCDDDPEECEWDRWGPWTVTNNSPCTENRMRTRLSPCTGTEYDTERDCVCVLYSWSSWSLKTADPCIQDRTRWRVYPCNDWIYDERTCEEACSYGKPNNVAEQGVIEGPAGPRRKRDLPWCPEEEWVIYGRDDGCMARHNVTWYKCINEICQDCVPPYGTGLVCVQNKIMTIRVLLLCGDGSEDTMVVERSMACTCHEVVNTCDKFRGPCG